MAAYVGYHGTAKRKALAIQRTCQYKVSRDTADHPQWLGDGVYFFQDSVAWARKYAIEVKKFKYDYGIVRSEIESDNVFDLLEPDDADFFHYVAQNILMLTDEDEEVSALKNGYVVNFMYNNGLRVFDVARAAFPWMSEAYSEKLINIPRYSHIQLCVRNPSCIKTFNIEEVV